MVAPPYDVADLSLAGQGRARTEFAERSMPVLGLLRERFAAERPFDGVRIAACMHVSTETAALVRALAAGGAQVYLAAANPLSTQDDVAAALTAQGVGVHARRGVDRAGYVRHLEAVLAACPQLLLDDGCDLVQVLRRRPDLARGVLAGCEETTTGVLRLRQMAADGALGLPMVAVNDTPTQLLVGRHGTGQSTLDAVMRTTGTLLAGAVVVVAGYGWCGSGIAARARGMGASCIVTEVDAGRALEALLDGHRVLPMAQAAPLADVLVTATGNKHVVSAAHIASLRDGAVLVNAGHFDVEIDVPALRAAAVRVQPGVRPHVDEYVLPGGRRLLLLAQGRVANLSAADGHPPAVMDLSFAVQALTLQWLVGRDLPPGVHAVPPQLDAEVARTRLAVMGVATDELTAEQRGYLSSWRP